MAMVESVPGRKPRFNRVLLKLSGEALAPAGQDSGVDLDALANIALEIKEIAALGVELAIVIGAGNFIRGSEYEARGMDRSTADQMGMLATVINALALQNALEHVGVSTRVLSAVTMQAMCEPYIRRRALRHLEKGRVVIFAAGTGNPYFTTDSAAALRATEIHADVLLKATRVDGVYDKDPHKFPDAKRFERVTYLECLQKDLKVMDMTAFALCRDNKLPIVVFDLGKPGGFADVLRGRGRYTIINGES